MRVDHVDVDDDISRRSGIKEGPILLTACSPAILTTICRLLKQLNKSWTMCTWKCCKDGHR